MGGRTSAAATPVLLNVYDLTAANDYLYWLGFGVFHSGIEVHGMEYGFGAHDFPSSGVFEVESKTCPGFVYRRTVWLGTTDMSQEEFRSFIEKLAGSVFDCLLPESVQVSPVGRVPTRCQTSDDDLHSIHSPIIEDSDNDEDEAKHLLPTPSNDMHSVDVPPKLAKDLL
ncbi:deSI-like protein At4g17486 isoform X2 [Panicum virgatum]|uniref:deSI-like protein At4g17486 isoform X2 n=1 Tax=Panicum virgatum TaxID=38727 RepID=UPI0019D603A3|nr:deSI-like protein At4g17486 isoform X2 [Panicum virgatum]